jgi:hypothetical protein
MESPRVGSWHGDEEPRTKRSTPRCRTLTQRVCAEQASGSTPIVMVLAAIVMVLAAIAKMLAAESADAKHRRASSARFQWTMDNGQWTWTGTALAFASVS